MSGLADGPVVEYYSADKLAGAGGQDVQPPQLNEDDVPAQTVGAWPFTNTGATAWGVTGTEWSSSTSAPSGMSTAASPPYGIVPETPIGPYDLTPYEHLTNPFETQYQVESSQHSTLTAPQWPAGYQGTASVGTWPPEMVADPQFRPAMGFNSSFDGSEGATQQEQEREPPKRKRGRPRLALNLTRATTPRTCGGLGSPVSRRVERRKSSSTLSDDPEREVVRSRNRAAATRYRNKIQAITDQLEAEEREASLQRQSLIACATQLREEVYHLKTAILQHSDCRDPLIQGYLSNATQQAYAVLATPEITWTAGSNGYTDVDHGNTVHEVQTPGAATSGASSIVGGLGIDWQF
ncbi:hypothetical protein OQA88_9969 [Cercophora sp. LCS_1]